MSGTIEAIQAQLRRQIAHWRAASLTLDDAENFASAEAWAELENYLSLTLRAQLQGSVDRLKQEIEGIATEASVATTLPELEATRLRLVSFRRLFQQTETVLEFYGDAVSRRTNPRLASLLRSCDLLAERAMAAALVPMGHQVPPTLTYIDKGLGASILQAGVRLWDGGSISPAAAIKITRHNLYRPTSLIHEAGHQVAHVLGWNSDLRSALLQVLQEQSPALAEMWATWASEIAADVYAFVNTGYAAVAALHDVIAGEETQVFQVPAGDPHPVAYLRVLLNVRMCRVCFGAGPWDDLESAWTTAYPLEEAPPRYREALRASVAVIPAVTDACLTRPSQAFGGRAITELINPDRVQPVVLERLASGLGPALYQSSHWAAAEPLRLLAWFGLRMATEPARMTDLAEEYESWMLSLGAGVRD